MLKEFVESIGAMAVMSHPPRVFRDPYDPRKAYLHHDGAVREIVVAPPLLEAAVETVEGLFAAIHAFGAENDASVWHDQTQIVALLSNEDRLETVTLRLCYSEQFQAIQQLPKAFDQRSLILFLKRELGGAVDDSLIAVFRQLDFTKREEAGGSIKHGDESLGRGVHAAVTGRTDIPEFINVSVPILTNPDLVYSVSIRLSVDIDLQRCAIQLTPMPDEIERAFRLMQSRVHRVLQDQVDCECQVFQGTPRLLKATN